MFSHMNVGVYDVAAAVAFYSEVLAPLGVEQKYVDVEAGVAAWNKPGEPRPTFVVCLPLSGEESEAGIGQMVAFEAPSRDAVAAVHAAAIALGGTDEGQPGLRPHYHPNYFGAYFRDPDGNKICVCHHGDTE